MHLNGAVYIERSNGTNDFYYTYTDNIGSLTALVNADGTIAERYAYDPWGRRRNPDNWLEADTRTSFILNRGYTGHEHIDQFGIINMNGRVYDPLTAQFLSPDPYVQAPDNWLNYNWYSYAMNNPFSYVDPSGEIAWFVPVIIGAVIGGVSGGMIGHANGAEGWDMVGYIAVGAVIGGLSGGAASGVSALGGGAAVAGATAGAVSGAGFDGLATNWDGGAMLKGATFGAISGFVGGGTSAAIGGGWGALAGGATSNLTSRLLYNKGDFSKVNWLSVGVNGAVSFGLYHGMSFPSWKWGGGNKPDGISSLSYKQFCKINRAYQLSRFWRREFGVYLSALDGSAKITPWRDTGKHHVRFYSKKGNVYKTMHAHWDKAGRNIGNNEITVGGYHSPQDMMDFKGTSIVVGRTTSTIFHAADMATYSYINPDPFIRFFLFPYLSFK